MNKSDFYLLVSILGVSLLFIGIFQVVIQAIFQPFYSIPSFGMYNVSNYYLYGGVMSITGIVLVPIGIVLWWKRRTELEATAVVKATVGLPIYEKVHVELEHDGIIIPELNLRLKQENFARLEEVTSDDDRLSAQNLSGKRKYLLITYRSEDGKKDQIILEGRSIGFRTELLKRLQPTP